MAGAHEELEHSEHIEHASHSNKGIALLISILALCLAFSETLGKGAQTESITANVRSNDAWAYYQAKVIRIKVGQTAAENMALLSRTVTDPALKEEMAKQVEVWRKDAAKDEDDPGRNGRKQQMEKARAAEEERDTALARYHHYEFASAAFQIGIVLASATIITGIMALAWIAGGLGVIGLAFMAVGLFAPHVLHLMGH